jgi:hypothetical protein
LTSLAFRSQAAGEDEMSQDTEKKKTHFITQDIDGDVVQVGSISDRCGEHY